LDTLRKVCGRFSVNDESISLYIFVLNAHRKRD
jgi:hypothetical protein